MPPPPRPVKIDGCQKWRLIFHVSWPPSPKFLDPLLDLLLTQVSLDTILLQKNCIFNSSFRVLETLKLVFFSILQDNICLEAFSRAHFRSIQDKRMRLIVLLVGDPPRDQMPEDLQNFIKTGSYLKWQEKWFWKKLIYKMPHVSRTPRSLNPPDYFRNKFLGNLPNGDIRHHSFSFSDDGQEIPMGSFFSDSSGLNDTRSENYVHDSSLVSDAYISQCASDFNDDIQKEAILASPEEEMTDEEPKEANSLINGNHV